LRCVFLFYLLLFIGCHPTLIERSFPSKEEVLAQEILDLVKYIDTFPTYERKQVFKRLKETKFYIIKQISERIDKHPSGIKI